MRNLAMNLAASNFIKSAPYDAEIQYLEAPKIKGWGYGTVINTGMRVNSSYTYELELYWFSAQTKADTTWMRFFGTHTSDSNSMYLSSNSYAQYDNLRLMIDNGKWYVYSSSNRWLTLKIDIPTRKFYCNSSVVTSSLTIPKANTQNIFLFGAFSVQTNGMYDGASRIRKYTVSTSTGTKIQEFIPVRKNGIGYMYDKVSKQLFGMDMIHSVAGCPFILGPDV